MYIHFKKKKYNPWLKAWQNPNLSFYCKTSYTRQPLFFPESSWICVVYIVMKLEYWNFTTLLLCDSFFPPGKEIQSTSVRKQSLQPCWKAESQHQAAGWPPTRFRHIKCLQAAWVPTGTAGLDHLTNKAALRHRTLTNLDWLVSRASHNFYLKTSNPNYRGVIFLDPCFMAHRQRSFSA